MIKKILLYTLLPNKNKAGDEWFYFYGFVVDQNWFIIENNVSLHTRTDRVHCSADRLMTQSVSYTLTHHYAGRMSEKEKEKEP